MNHTSLGQNEAPLEEDGIVQFFKDIEQFPPLTSEQEDELAKACAQGDEEAIRKMVSSNLLLVVWVAKKFVRPGVLLMDLIQEGSIGLLDAARRFDRTLDIRFSTYATKLIRFKILEYLQDQEMIHIPRSKAERIQKIAYTREKLVSQLGRQPTAAELAAQVGLPENVVLELQKLPKVCSLDAPAGDDDITLQGLLEDEEACQPQQELVRRELGEMIRALLGALTERQQQVLRLRYGMDDGVCHSFEQIGKALDISKQRARQIESEAIAKLKKLGAGVGLEDFLE